MTTFIFINLYFISEPMEGTRTALFILNLLYFRAYGGDEDGSVYLQAFATFLQDQYLNIPLDRIYLMVKRAMIEAKQAQDFTKLRTFK